MSCSISSIDWPWSARSRRRAPSSALSRVSRPAAGSSRHSSRGPAASARATPTSLRWPMDSWSGMACGRPVHADQASSAPGRPERTPSPLDATVRFSRTSRSSKSSVLCQVRPSPRRARSWGGSPPMSAAASSTRPVHAHEAGNGVHQRGLARAVRPDQADELAFADLQRDVAQRVHAAERDGQAGDAQHGGAAGEIARGVRAAAARLLRYGGRARAPRPAARGSRAACAVRR